MQADYSITEHGRLNMNRESRWFNKNTRRFIAGGLAIFIIIRVCEFIIHGPLLGDLYATIPNIWRQDMMSLMWIIYLGSFIFSFLLMFAFIKGYEDRGILEGVRFGLMFGIMTSGLGAFYQYVVYPIPLSLAIQWFCYSLVEFIIAGIAAALIYRPQPEDETGEAEDDLEIVD